MQLSISGHHLDITEALHNYVNSKFKRLSRHNKYITNAHVILTVAKLDNKAEATVHINGADIYADAISQDMYASIDDLADKLDRQLIKYKEKRSHH